MAIFAHHSAQRMKFVKKFRKALQDGRKCTIMIFTVRARPAAHQNARRKGGGEVASVNNRIRIEILDTTYTITSVESEEYVQKLAKELDAQVRAILEQNGRVSTNAALVLCAMGYADALQKSEANCDRMRAQLADYLEDANALRRELDQTRRTLDELRRSQH